MPQPKKQTVHVARSEKAGRRTVVIRGETFEVPGEMPFATAAYLADGQLLRGVQMVFGDDTERFLDLGIGVSEFDEVLSDVYGLDSGGSTASSGS